MNSCDWSVPLVGWVKTPSENRQPPTKLSSIIQSTLHHKSTSHISLVSLWDGHSCSQQLVPDSIAVSSKLRWWMSNPTETISIWWLITEIITYKNAESIHLILKSNFQVLSAINQFYNDRFIYWARIDYTNMMESSKFHYLHNVYHFRLISTTKMILLLYCVLARGQVSLTS